MNYELLKPGNPRWLAALAACEHDFYHLPCYQQLAARPDEECFAFLASDGEQSLLMPFLKRPLPKQILENEMSFDAGSAYGYAGPVSSRGATREFRRNALASFENFLISEQVVCGFFRVHTILNDPRDFEGIGELVNHGPSVYIDLSHSEEELWAQTRRGHKRDLAVLKKRGYSFVIDDWSRLDDFIKCYHESMKRLGASDFYFFQKSYFEALRMCLGEDAIHLCLVYAGEEIACAGIVTEIDGLCQYHLSATADAHFQDHPSKLMLHFIRSWLRGRGNRLFHVGGGVGALRDTLHLFKAGFSPYSSDFYTWRLVTGPERYATAVRRWVSQSGRQPVDRNDFFPQYRAPLAD